MTREICHSCLQPHEFGPVEHVKIEKLFPMKEPRPFSVRKLVALLNHRGQIEPLIATRKKSKYLVGHQVYDEAWLVAMEQCGFKTALVTVIS